MDAAGGPAHATPPLETAGVVIVRGGNRVLGDVTLTVRAGSLVALSGPSGSGKTSLLRVLAQLDKPAAGVVRFWGAPVHFESDQPFIGEHPLYPRLGYVSQTLSLWPHLTIRENLQFARKHALADDAFDRLCEDLEISDIVDRLPRFASQGQQQRAALARTLLLRPSILLLDEITAALDERLASKVWTLLRGLAHSGTSVLASTHDPRLASASDYALRIRDNTIVELR